MDVLRAFTVAHLAMMQGVERIYLVSSIDEAFDFKTKHPEYLLAGEKDGLAIEGFDLDNSPAALLSHDLNGKTLVQKTSNGTKATLENLDADKIFVTGFSNSRQLVNYLHTLAIQTLQVIPSRLKDDDFAVKDYIQALYDQKETSQLDIIGRIVHSDVAEKFFTDSRFNPKDVIYATSEIKCDFVMEVKNIGTNNVYIEKCFIE
nr:2-phosphosulfolactate phosphatase [Sulfurimonas sp. hsl 1-7]